MSRRRRSRSEGRNQRKRGKLPPRKAKIKQTLPARGRGVDPGSALRASAGATVNPRALGSDPAPSQGPGGRRAGSAAGDAPWASLQALAMADNPAQRFGARRA